MVKAISPMSIETLKEYIKNKIPVICLIQAWAKISQDYTNEWKYGHYVIAIGYDKKNIYFMDPSIPDAYGYLRTEEFLHRWHDISNGEKLYQLDFHNQQNMHERALL